MTNQEYQDQIKKYTDTLAGYKSTMANAISNANSWYSGATKGHGHISNISNLQGAYNDSAGNAKTTLGSYLSTYNAANASMPGEQKLIDTATAALGKQQLGEYQSSVENAKTQSNASFDAALAQAETEAQQAGGQNRSTSTQPGGEGTGFDVNAAAKAAISKTGASSSGSKQSKKMGAGQDMAPPSSTTGADKNQFSLPDVQGIQFGGA